jgi:zinc/manganese transport system substrate-binding protein/manganese/iron transport system substrate-binding protein
VIALRLGLAVVALASILAIAGCGAASGSPSTGDRIRVVATTTVLADLVARVGGDRVSVASLVPPGGEVHTFDPSPGDVSRVAEAHLVVANGLGLDAWVLELVTGAGGDAATIELAAAVDATDYIVTEGRPNPHLWLDPTLAAAYGRSIAAALGEIQPASRDAFGNAGEAYATHLAGVEDELHRQLEAIPDARRRIVSFHDAFPYFARAFDLEIVGSILESPGQDPSAGELAALVETIRETGATAVVSEIQFSPNLARTVAAETGAEVVSDLYTDTLGPPPVDSYEGLLRWDVQRLVEALR